MESDNQSFWKLDLSIVVYSPSVVTQEFFQHLKFKNETVTVRELKNNSLCIIVSSVQSLCKGCH